MTNGWGIKRQRTSSKSIPLWIDEFNPKTWKCYSGWTNGLYKCLFGTLRRAFEIAPHNETLRSKKLLRLHRLRSHWICVAWRSLRVCRFLHSFELLYMSEFTIDTHDTSFICWKVWAIYALIIISVPTKSTSDEILSAPSNNLQADFACGWKGDRSSADKISSDKREISGEPSQSPCAKSPKESKVCFLRDLSRGISAFCIFYSKVLADKEEQRRGEVGAGFCGLKDGPSSHL